MIGKSMSNAQKITEIKCIKFKLNELCKKGFEDETSLRGVDL